MSIRESHKIIDALAIRDTSNHNSTVSDSVNYQAKTILIISTLDEDVTLQLQASCDLAFTDVIDVGSTFTATKLVNGYESVDTYFPYFRVTAICATAPTTGVLTIVLEKVGT